MPPDFLPGMEPPDSPGQSIIPARKGLPHDAEAWDPLPTWSILAADVVGESGAMHQPAAAGAPDTEGSTSAQYILRTRVAVGGMGEVWSALQVSLGRHVAVKRLRDPQGEPQSLHLRRAEFRQEAVIAGLLEHPNIVPVHDLGTDPDGNPLICMKLVEGQSWDKLLRQDFEALESEEFLGRHLQVLLAVSHAVAFAHTRGIIHRDLKPGQVIVGSYGEVMLTDWGLSLCYDERATPAARERHEELGDSFALPSPISASNPAGTPAFMAPEQTLPHAGSVGPWTDVYLLGGTLYQLLTGTPPHNGATKAACILKAQEGGIEHPASRCPGRHHPEPLVDLCLRALEVLPERRPPDAAAFAAGLTDHLTGAANRARSRELTREVANGPVPQGYAARARAIASLEEAVRLWPENPQARTSLESLLVAQADESIRNGDLLLARLTLENMAEGEDRLLRLERYQKEAVARQRALQERRLLRLGAVALLAILLAGGTWFARELQQGREAALQARDVAATARKSAEDLLAFMIGDLRDRLEPIGRVDVLDALGRKASGYLDSLPPSERVGVAALQRITAGIQLAAILRLQGHLRECLESLDAQDAALRSIPRSGVPAAEHLAAQARLSLERGLASQESGALDAADAAFRRALESCEKLATLQPQNRDWAASRAEALRGMADILTVRGLGEEAYQLYDQAGAELQELVFAHPDDMALRHGLARIRLQQALADEGRGEQLRALLRLEETIAAFSALLAEDPRNAAWQAQLARAELHHGTIILAMGSDSRALPDLHDASRLFRELADADPANLQARNDLAEGLFRESQALIAAGAKAEGIAHSDESLALSRSVVAANPSNAAWRKGLATTLAGRAQVADESDDPALAATLYAEAVRVIAGVALADPHYKEARGLLDQCRQALTPIINKLTIGGRLKEATDANEAVVDAIERLHEQAPEDVGLLVDVATAHLFAASHVVERGIADDRVQQHLQRCREAIDQVLKLEPANRDARNYIATLPALQGRCYRLRDMPREAMKSFEEMEAMSSQQAAQGATTGEKINGMLLLSASLRFQSLTALDMGETAVARAAWNRSRKTLDDCVAILDPTDVAGGQVRDLMHLSLLVVDARICLAEGNRQRLEHACQETLRLTDGKPAPKELDARIAALVMLGRKAEALELVPRREAFGPLSPDTRKLLE